MQAASLTDPGSPGCQPPGLSTGHTMSLTASSTTGYSHLTPINFAYSGLPQLVARTFTLRINNQEMPQTHTRPWAKEAMGSPPLPQQAPRGWETEGLTEECRMLSQRANQEEQQHPPGLQHSATREHLPKQKLPVLVQLLCGREDLRTSSETGRVHQSDPD